MNKIETFLFKGKNYVHQIVDLHISSEEIQITLSELVNNKERCKFIFKSPKLEYLQSDEMGEAIDFRAGIIGIDEQAFSDQRHKFVFKTDDWEMAFISQWPTFSDE